MAKKKDSVSVLDVVRGLSQAAANAYDGAIDDEGKLREVGLQREEGDVLLDERVIDGFSIKFSGPLLYITYQTPVTLKEVYANGFEGEMDQTMGDISSFLKKEYRKVTGKSVSLTKEDEIDIRVENSTRVRSWAVAQQKYKIGGIEEVVIVGEASEDRLAAGWQKFLDQGGWKGKRPKNDTRPKGETK